MNKADQFITLVQTGAIAAASKSNFEPGTGATKAMAAVMDAFRIVDGNRLPEDLTASEAAIQLLNHSGLLGETEVIVPAWLEIR
jgi:hypothetical protein